MWYETRQWKNRLVLEVAVMESRFPQFVLQRERDGTLRWEGIVSPQDDSVFWVSISYPQRYPYCEPVLRLVEPKLRPRTPHVYKGGSICVHPKAWDPSRGTAASEIPLLCDWLRYYLVWCATGVWPKDLRRR